MLKYLANVSKPSEKKRKRDDDYDKEYEKAKRDRLFSDSKSLFTTWLTERMS